MIQNKKSFISGSIMVLVSIIIGAFAAHALKKTLLPERLESVETGARYLMYSGLGLLIISFVQIQISKIPSLLIIMGAILFSGSIFLLTCLNHNTIDFPKIIGLITPIGGALMIAGWLILCVKAIKN